MWGRSKSNVTGTGDEYSVRIDRQNPTPTASNIHIQTNGNSVSIAMVLVRDELAGKNRGAVLAAVRQAFRGSLADGMQWEVYDAPVEEKEQVYVKGGKKGGGGNQGKKGGYQGKKGGGGGGQGGRRGVKV